MRTSRTEIPKYMPENDKPTDELYVDGICVLCGDQAAYQVVEVTKDTRHPHTAFLCDEHFRMIMKL